MTQVKQISENEIYLLIKYIKSVLWIEAKRLSYKQDARCLKVKLNDTLHLLACGEEHGSLGGNLHKAEHHIHFTSSQYGGWSSSKCCEV